MNLCSEGHDEIYYEGRSCPACLLKEDRDCFEKETCKLSIIVGELEAITDDLKNKLKAETGE